MCLLKFGNKCSIFDGAGHMIYHGRSRSLMITWLYRITTCQALAIAADQFSPSNLIYRQQIDIKGA